jgi:Zn-dependent alcohol dehydrogenase
MSVLQRAGPQCSKLGGARRSSVYRSGTGWFAADAANVKPGGTVVVVGDGAVGLLGILSARQMGAGRIIAMSRHP